MAKKQKQTTKKSIRLGMAVLPKHYAITLKPDLEAHVFFGHETITISLSKPTKKIVLHSKDLNIKTANVIFGKKNIVASSISYDLKSETVLLKFETTIPKGICKLSLVFEGILADNMRGFYKSKYTLSGKEYIMATTQFEATDARRAFPCFDEPTHKAIFDVNLIIPSDKSAISNTLPTSVIEHEAGYKIVSFASTPKMSTYLLAFVVGEFEWLEAKTKSGVQVRILTIPGKSHQGKFALDVTVRCLEFYEEYFNIAYPLNTLDMIAIPDFEAAAMENWGAITFREAYLLLDEERTSTSTKQHIAEVIAHELAHQWFGNLVTMEWWTHLWLNEGFATYIPYLALNSLFPSWNVWEEFTIGTLAVALKLDALKNTHPVEVAVHDPSEIGEIFDAVSYKKGASIIRMLAEYLGEKDFRDGLRYYLKKHSYKNASTIHLWEAFEKVSKKPVKKMMSIWTGKPGYPILFAKLVGGNMILSQKRYFSSITSAKKTGDKTIWPIPLSFVSKDGESKLSLMTKKQIRVPVPMDSWFKFNSYEGSLYRVCYDKQVFELLREPLSLGTLSVEDRLGIIRDIFSFAESGEQNTILALETTLLYVNETEYVVWVEILAGLRSIANLLRGTKSYEAFALYSRKILSNILVYVGWEAQSGESENNALLRALVLGSSISFGDIAVINEAKRRFANRNEITIPADLRDVVYGAIAKEGGESEYEVFLSMYRNETSHEEKNRILLALGQFKDKKILSRALLFAMTDEVRLQDKDRVLMSVILNKNSRTLGWSFVKKNWKNIVGMYGEVSHTITRIISVLSCNTTVDVYTDIQTFFKMHQVPSAERTISQTLERIDSHIKWLARDEINITQWLKKYKS